MHLILGANGHVGSAVAQALLDQREPITVVLHDDKKATDWQRKGARTAVADVHDSEALRQVLRQGQRLFLLNPPADPATDASAQERRTVASIVAALQGSGLKKIVAQSTYGAQPGEQLGDLSVLYEMEQALVAQPIPVSIVRAAYYMSNWDASLATARQEGKVHTLYPVDFKLPMVAPHDIGQLAARLLTAPVGNTSLHSIEGPATYSAAEVAAAFAAALGRPVEAVETPRAQWVPTLRQLGFSEPAAESFAHMTAATLAGQGPVTENPTRGTTSLQQYIQALVASEQ